MEKDTENKRLALDILLEILYNRIMKKYLVIIRIFTGITLILAWGLCGTPLLGVALILFLTAISAVRYHFKPYIWCAVAEVSACVIYAFLWLPALLGLWFTVIGFLERKWNERESQLLQNEYSIRTELLKFEQTREQSEFQMRKVAHLTELSERTRIAQDIHDHVGHEISGTLIALRIALVLYEKNDERAGELLKQSVSRLESASENLRETVHNLKPTQIIGAETFRELCEDFTFCKVEFTANVSVINNSEILAANLKEALTNISRHSNATKVNVRLNDNTDYIRLTVHDNGTINNEFKFGMGLDGMRERIRAVGGTMSITTDNGFKIVCIIPKKRSDT